MSTGPWAKSKVILTAFWKNREKELKLDKKKIILMSMLSLFMCGAQQISGSSIAKDIVIAAKDIATGIVWTIGGIIAFFSIAGVAVAEAVLKVVIIFPILKLGELAPTAPTYTSRIINYASSLWNRQAIKDIFDKFKDKALEIKEVLDTFLVKVTISSTGDAVFNFLCTDEFRSFYKKKEIGEFDFYKNLDTEGTDNIKKFQNLMSFISACFKVRNKITDALKKETKEKKVSKYKEVLESLDHKLTDLYMEINQSIQEKIIGKKKRSWESWSSKVKSEQEKIQTETTEVVAEAGPVNESNMGDVEIKTEEDKIEKEKTEQEENFKKLLSKDSYSAMFKMKSALFRVMTSLFGESIFTEKEEYASGKSYYSVKNFARAGILIPLYNQINKILPTEDDIDGIIYSYNQNVTDFLAKKQRQETPDSYFEEVKEIDSSRWARLEEKFNQKIDAIKAITTPTEEQKEQVDALFKELLVYLALPSQLGISKPEEVKEENLKNKNFQEKLDSIKYTVGLVLKALDAETTSVKFREFVKNSEFLTEYSVVGNTFLSR